MGSKIRRAEVVQERAHLSDSKAQSGPRLWEGPGISLVVDAASSLVLYAPEVKDAFSVTSESLLLATNTAYCI